VRLTYCAPAVADYVIDVSEATRSHPDVVIGASPRATLGVLHTAQAHAVIAGRDFVTPEDVKAVSVAALAHRLVLAGGPDIHAAGALVRSLLDQLPVPTAHE
jgi:MoxR-like ATPase